MVLYKPPCSTSRGTEKRILTLSSLRWLVRSKCLAKCPFIQHELHTASWSSRFVARWFPRHLWQVMEGLVVDALVPSNAFRLSTYSTQWDSKSEFCDAVFWLASSNFSRRWFSLHLFRKPNDPLSISSSLSWKVQFKLDFGSAKFLTQFRTVVFSGVKGDYDERIQNKMVF